MNKTIEARVARFNRIYSTYAEAGLSAFQTLQKMKRDGYTNIDIADHFGVSQQTMVTWNKDFFPRVDSLS